MLVTDDDRLAERLRLLRSHGMTSLTWDRHKGHAWSYDVTGLGYNYRIDEIRSAIGRVQLKKLEHNNQVRRALTALYHEAFHELCPQVELPFLGHPGLSACHLLPMLLPPGTDRTRFMEQMKSRGIQTSIHYPPIHQFSAFREDEGQWNDGRGLGLTETVAAREVTLPLYPALTAEQARQVVEAVCESLDAVH